jgi:hypothetical protein
VAIEEKDKHAARETTPSRFFVDTPLFIVGLFVSDTISPIKPKVIFIIYDG